MIIVIYAFVILFKKLEKCNKDILLYLLCDFKILPATLPYS